MRAVPLIIALTVKHAWLRRRTELRGYFGWRVNFSFRRAPRDFLRLRDSLRHFSPNRRIVLGL
jgi:hypothetical protein